MPVVPDRKQEQIDFAQQHLAPWTANAAALGLTSNQLTALSEATEAADSNYRSARELRQQAKAATAQADLDIRFMNTLVGDAVKAIRLKAESTNDPKIYAVAQIPAPAAPTAALPPTQPTDLRAVIGTTGGLTIQWKPSAATAGLDNSTSGVLFTVRRRLAGQTGWTIVGTARPARGGSRSFSSFTDESLPANPQGLEYTVQGVRSGGRTADLAGPVSNIFRIAIGMTADGTMTVSTPGAVGGAGGLKMAA